jgi:trans-aconitate methyltransferase
MVEFLTKEGRAHEADVVGIDLSEEMLEIASERFPDATFVLGDALTATLTDLQPGADEVTHAPAYCFFFITLEPGAE